MRQKGRPDFSSADTSLARRDVGAGGGTIKAFLESPGVRYRLLEVATSTVNPDRLIRIALAAARRNPRLLECSQESILMALMEAAACGIEPCLPDHRANLIPRKNKKTGQLEAQFSLEYRGIIELMRRSGDVASAEARVVYEEDHWEHEYGLNPVLVHRPLVNGDRGQPILAYSIIRLKDPSASPIIDVMSYAEIEAVRKRSPAAQDGPWVTDWSEMARKTVLRRNSKYAPMGSAEASAIRRDADREDDLIDTSVVGLADVTSQTPAQQEEGDNAGSTTDTQ